LMPKAAESLMRAVGAQRFGEEAARMNVEAGGRITGVSIAPDIEEQLAGHAGLASRDPRNLRTRR
jgi:hypothetical protein